MNKKKLTIISHMSELYGAPRSLLPIIDILVKSFDVHVVTFGDTGMPQTLEKKGIPYTIIPLVKYDKKKILSRIKRKIQNYYGDYYFTFMVKKVLKTLNPDLVYVNTVSRGAPVIAADSLGIPVIVHVRESILYFNKSKFIDRRRIHAVTTIPKCYFTVSESTKQMIVDQGVDDKKVFCVHSGIDLTSFSPDNNIRCDNIFGFVGNMTERKGIKDFIQISTSLINKNKSLSSYVIGGNPNSNIFKQTYNLVPKDLRGQFVFTGKVDSVSEYYKKMSVFCLTSKEEPFARVLIEAMGAALPVIAFDTGGVKELVDDGINGYVIPQGNFKLYEEKLNFLMENKEIRISMGINGQKKVLDNFKLKDYQNRIKNIIIPKIVMNS